MSHINNIEIFDSSVVKLYIFVLRSLSLDLLWLKGISSGGSSSRSLKSFDEWWLVQLDWIGLVVSSPPLCYSPFIFVPSIQSGRRQCMSAAAGGDSGEVVETREHRQLLYNIQLVLFLS